MKRLYALLLSLLVLAGIMSGCKKPAAKPSGDGNGEAKPVEEQFSGIDPTVLVDGETDAEFEIDFSTLGKTINNKLTDMNFFTGFTGWDSEEMANLDPSYCKTRYPFLTTINFMQATGGDSRRDLIKGQVEGPAKNWTDATPLITACLGLLLLPFIMRESSYVPIFECLSLKSDTHHHQPYNKIEIVTVHKYLKILTVYNN